MSSSTGLASDPTKDAGTVTVKFWGVRGTLPVAGPEFAHYGGNTICIEVRCGPHVLLFDAGSGLRPAGKVLAAEGLTDINLFFSHCHYDHIIGFPYFDPMFKKKTSICVWSGHLAGVKTTSDMLREFMSPPWFPAPLDICTATLETRDFDPGDTLSVAEGLTIRTGMLNHPGNAVGYRVEWGGRVIAIITDTEHEPGVNDPTVLQLIEGADLFIYDSTYSDEEMKRYRGYGHSSWQQGIRLAEEAKARKVAFIHHAQWRTDPELATIDERARLQFPGAFVARDGQTLVL
ncbi:MBL fold metallo-hydrolase [Sinorhizobium sp. BG8]|uniref:MBL fold metallo-hydrolase n=1 Tax=Sinorhizobium sp. BG8 TaxID=2613773 RepID=UPI00193E562C|nr:MBL fold metallo-hydrolase [Sinorhizobium sp. BG8]QRM53876.1 MBL fold metallo-hydrolase [Sinorhizobium sp. BG8]